MNLFSPKTLAAAAGLAIPTVALANTVDFNMPLTVADVETAGVNSTVSLTVTETDATNNLAAGEVARVFVTVVSIDAAGATTTLVENIEVTAGAGGTVLGAGANATTNIAVDLSGFASNLTLAANSAPANSIGIGLVFTVDDQGGAATTGIVQGGNFDTDGTPTASTDGAVFDNDPVTISSAFLDADNDNLFLAFSRSLNAGDNGAFPGGNDPNQTTAAEANAIVAADVLIDNDNDFNDADEQVVNGGAFGAATAFLAGSNGTVLEITYNNANTNVTTGAFVRLADTANADAITDVLGNQVNNNVATAANQKGDEDGVVITALADLTVTAVTAEETVTGDAAVNDAIRVQYNLPLNPADLGNDVFYSDFLQDADGDTAFEITNITVDPDDNAAVLLQIDRTGVGSGDNLYADALDDDGDSYTLLTDVTDALRNEPGSVFDGADAGANAKDDYQAAAQTLTITDNIDPGFEFFAWEDTNGDGKVDAVSVVFNEPVTPGSTNNTGFALDVLTGQTVNPVTQIDEEGDLVTDTTAAAAIPEADLTVASAGVRPSSGPDRLASGNAVRVSFDPDGVDFDGDGNDANAGDTEEAFIGNDGPATVLTIDHPEVVVTDGSGNSTTVAANTDVAVNTDRAAPAPVNWWFLTGDNIDDGGNNFDVPNTQLIAENDGNVGDQERNDRFVLVASEDLVGAFDLDQFQIGGSAWQADIAGGDRTARPADISNNIVTVENRRTGPDNNFDADDVVAFEGFGPGDVATLTSDIGLDDAADNVVSGSSVVTDRTAPYIRLIEDRDGGAALDSAFLLDNDGDGLADQVLANFTDTVEFDTLNVNDFTVTNPASGVTVSAVTTSSGGDDGSVLLTLSGSFSMDGEMTIEYDGAQADTNDRLLADVDGNTVSPTASDFLAQEVQSPNVEGQQVAVQTITGVGTDADGNPFSVGSRIVAFLGTPTAKRINATHNNVSFRYDRAALDYGETIGSLEAFTDYLLGLEDFIYLNRDAGNNQTFVNQKDSATEGSADGDSFDFNTDILQINLNASNLTRLSFTSSGERSGNRATGDVSLCWDVFRSANGTLSSLFENGFDIGGEPIIAGETVVTQTDGSFVLHVTGPSARFWNRSRVSSVPLPIILVVIDTDGERTAVTSMLDGVSGPLVFNSQNIRQNQDGTAPANTTYNIDLANTGTELLYGQWNLLEFARVGGYATRTQDIPVLPAGVGTGDVTTASSIPLTGAFDQFLYFVDDNQDGMWTAADDGDDFDSILIDPSCSDMFFFTLDDGGVDTAGAAFVGGYAAGVYNGTGEWIGAFQFGAPLSSSSIFTTADPFPNNTTTLGWGLFTVTSGGTVDETTLFTNNTGLDFAIVFDNDEGDIDIQNSGAEDIEVESPQAIFGHYQRP